MAQLLVRRLDDDLVRKLKIRAARHGRSAEAEHREILREALEPAPRSASFKEALRGMPRIGSDKDFDRLRDLGRKVDL